MSDETKSMTSRDVTDPAPGITASREAVSDDEPRYVPKRRRGVDPRFFPPMELPAKPVQGELFGRKPQR